MKVGLRVEEFGTLVKRSLNGVHLHIYMHIDIRNGNLDVKHASGYIVHALMNDNPGHIQCAQKSCTPHCSINEVLNSVKHAMIVASCDINLTHKNTCRLACK